MKCAAAANSPRTAGPETSLPRDDVVRGRIFRQSEGEQELASNSRPNLYSWTRESARQGVQVKLIPFDMLNVLTVQYPGTASRYQHW